MVVLVSEINEPNAPIVHFNDVGMVQYVHGTLVRGCFSFQPKDIAVKDVVLMHGSQHVGNGVVVQNVYFVSDGHIHKVQAIMNGLALCENRRVKVVKE